MPHVRASGAVWDPFYRSRLASFFGADASGDLAGRCRCITPLQMHPQMHLRCRRGAKMGRALGRLLVGCWLLLGIMGFAVVVAPLAVTLLIEATR